MGVRKLRMPGFSILLQCTLAVVLVALAVLSIQLVWLAGIRMFASPRRLRLPLLPDEALPDVLVQLPVCDE